MAGKSQMLKGLLEGCVLKIIDGEPNYGYAICETLNACGFHELNEGTVYPILTRLERNGWLRCEKLKSPFGPKRKVYSLTELGKMKLGEFERTWSILRTNVDRILEGEGCL